MKYWENGFYLSQNKDNTRTEITEEYYNYLISEQNKGMFIYDDNGYPKIKNYVKSDKETQFEEYENLKYWFDTYYTTHEQKYRRLYTLNKNDDDGVSGYDKLIALYNEAETKRKRLQELEVLINEQMV